MFHAVVPAPISKMISKHFNTKSGSIVGVIENQNIYTVVKGKVQDAMILEGRKYQMSNCHTLYPGGKKRVGGE